MYKEALEGSLSLKKGLQAVKYKIDFYKNNPDFFRPEGLLIFCGPQGSGKTLSAVQYVKKVLKAFPKCKLVTNVEIKGLSEDTEIIEYTGIECLTRIENSQYGVLYFIDEIHLEFNSLESKNIDIEVMIEVSQQRKQRKHIVGTSQVYGRMAKPLREQIKHAVLCKNYFGILQKNQLIDGENTTEKDGHIETDKVKNFWFFHSPELYTCYDTYKKMKRYKKEWKGRKREVQVC